MQISSKDGNMVVDFYRCTTTSNILKVLSFRGDKQKKMLITREEFGHQVREYIHQYKYKLTSKYSPPQYHSEEVIS